MIWSVNGLYRPLGERIGVLSWIEHLNGDRQPLWESAAMEPSKMARHRPELAEGHMLFELSLAAGLQFQLR